MASLCKYTYIYLISCDVRGKVKMCLKDNIIKSLLKGAGVAMFVL